MRCRPIAFTVRLDVAKLNLMLSSDCSQIGTGSSNSLCSAKESVRTDTGSGVISWLEDETMEQASGRATQARAEFERAAALTRSVRRSQAGK